MRRRKKDHGLAPKQLGAFAARGEKGGLVPVEKFGGVPPKNTSKELPRLWGGMDDTKDEGKARVEGRGQEVMGLEAGTLGKGAFKRECKNQGGDQILGDRNWGSLRPPFGKAGTLSMSPLGGMNRSPHNTRAAICSLLGGLQNTRPGRKKSPVNWGRSKLLSKGTVAPL